MIPKISSLEEYKSVYKKSIEDPSGFWSEIADCFKWKKKGNQISSGNFHDVNHKWFEDSTLNITENYDTKISL